MKNKRTASELEAVMEKTEPSGRFRPRSRWSLLAAGALLALALAGCGDDGSDGAPGKDADPAVTDDLQSQIDAITKTANPETCVTCHTGDDPVVRSGANHQEIYKEFYQDGVVKVSEMAFTTSGGNTAVLTFKMTKNGAPFDCTKSTAATSDFSIGSYWAEYDVATKTFPSDLSLLGTKAYNPATNVCTFTKTGIASDVAAKMAGNGIVQIYGVDEIVERIRDGKRLDQGKYPFAGVLKVGTVDYSSAANVSGCENCHTRPFLKHAYIYGQVNGGQDFYTCKGCHFDTREGGHVDWQILKDNPARYAEIAAGSPITDAEKAKYAYKAKLMNDVHMSHAMEFAYPQSMKNCVTCHAGKLDVALADDKFKAETCKSCHAVDGLKEKMTTASFNHGQITENLDTTVCTVCHTTGGAAPSFKTVHSGGYDPKIYSTAGVRYSNAFVVKIDSASVDANKKLTIKFSASETTDVAGMSVSDIKPTVLVGLYGYDSKDFIVPAHSRDSTGQRQLEYVVGTAHPYFTTVSAANGSWEVTADLKNWAGKMADGSVKRAEIAVMPLLRHPTLEDPTSTATPPAKLVLGLNAPSRTFDLVANVFDDAYFRDIVKVAAGCNTCHDQLATTFHSGDRGGNIKVCRICHEVSSAGSHLELQSRSIDSYVHSIHSFQAFDPGNVNFGDPVESVEYEHHINSLFPRFGILNCESCHNPGMYNVPNQAKSMPGVLSGTDECAANTPECAVAGRKIGVIPPAVTGPAVRACGGCHRAQKLNADDANGLAILTQHFKTFGYVIDNEPGLWEAVVAKIMSVFK